MACSTKQYVYNTEEDLSTRVSRVAVGGMYFYFILYVNTISFIGTCSIIVFVYMYNTFRAFQICLPLRPNLKMYNLKLLCMSFETCNIKL